VDLVCGQDRRQLGHAKKRPFRPDAQSGYRHLYRKLYPETSAKSNGRAVDLRILPINKIGYKLTAHNGVIAGTGGERLTERM
jgi:hypothetical protein